VPADRSHDTDPHADTQAPESPETLTEKKRAVHTGDVLGRYELVEEIGEGGMATVYRARDRELRREVAIKVLFPHLARRPDVVRRFHREARAAAGLEHGNILRVYDVGGADGPDPPYIVMELIRGHSLLAEIERRGPMLAEVAACVGALLADALAVAHKAGIIHRDVKPANVMIAPGGRVLLADFGVARLETEDSSLVTKTGSVLGTPAYMSPEQASGDTATAKSDLYSLGATLYQLATGSLPYTGSPARVLSQIAQGLLVPASAKHSAVGPELSRVIERLMASEATARPANAEGIAAELRGIANAGGLGDAIDELAAYFADPEGFVRDRMPKVVAAVVAAGHQAIAAERLPRAIALADRASALAPDDPAVAALVQAVTEGGKATRRRRVAVVAGIGVLVAGGATFGAMQLVGGEAPGDAPGDAPHVAVVVADAAVMLDAAIDAPPVDAAEVAIADAAMRAPRDAHVAVAKSIDAEPPPRIDAAVAAAADAAIVPVDAAPAMGAIIVRSDAWCDVTIDGVSHGRVSGKPIQITAGHHRVVCEQTGTDKRWQQEIDVLAGKTASAAGSVLPPVSVRFEVDATIDGKDYPRGAAVQLKVGRYELVVDGKKTYFDLRGPCTVRAAPDVGCY